MKLAEHFTSINAMNVNVNAMNVITSTAQIQQ